MAYRRKHGVTRASTFKEEIYHQMNKTNEEEDHGNGGSLAARAIKASAAHRDSSAYAYAYTADPPPCSSSSSTTSSSSSHADPHSFRSHSFPNPKGPFLSESSSMKDPNDARYGFWGILARKAKSILEEDEELESSNRMKPQRNDTTMGGGQFHQPRQFSDSGARTDNARLRKGLDAITSSLNHLGDTLGNAFEEGRTIVEHKTADIIQETRNKTADIIQETRRLHMRRRGGGADNQDQATVIHNTSWQRPVIQPVQTHALTNQETQLKASRDVAMATAAKAKVLLRELKTVKADLAFAKERCAQLEEENKRLRESREKGDNHADDDLIRLQLETLLAEKARLAHENSIYARENRFLREIVEYHQLTMQDVVYLDECAEEVTEVYPFSIDDAKVLSSTPTSPISPTFFPEIPSLSFPPQMKEHVREVPSKLSNTTTVSQPSCPPQRKESLEVPTSKNLSDEEREASPSSKSPLATGEDPKRPLISST